MIVGIVLFATGLVVGFVPLSSGGVNCGSVFHESTDALVADYAATFVGGDGDTTHSANCSGTRSAVRIPTILLMVIGGGLLAVPLFWPQWFVDKRTPQAR